MAIITLTKDNFEETIETNNIVFVDYWAKWCGPCKSFYPIYVTTSEKFSDICFAQVNIEQEKELTEIFKIRSIPHIMVFKQQVVIFSESGVLPASGLEDLVHQAKAIDMKEVKEKLGE